MFASLVVILQGFLKSRTSHFCGEQAWVRFQVPGPTMVADVAMGKNKHDLKRPSRIPEVADPAEMM